MKKELPDTQQCGNCQFSFAMKAKGNIYKQWYCRRYPPSVFPIQVPVQQGKIVTMGSQPQEMKQGTASFYPPISVQSVCGEWYPRGGIPEDEETANDKPSAA